MKVPILTILGIFSSFFFFGCNNTTKETENKDKDSKEIPKEVSSEEEGHHHDADEAIVLDNGNKWKVVEPMLVYIRTMEEAINKFDGAHYEELAKTIDVNIRELTSKCTMEGQAHDELHKWLVPFIGLSEEFDAATELADQEKIYKDFKTALQEFNTYFE